MATQLQLRKGTKVQNDMFTGAEAELTYDSTSKGLRLHDGVQQGGYEVPVLVSVQRPTAENNYTWARVWSDGWVEQGGITSISTTTSNNTYSISIPLAIEMADNNYTGFCQAAYSGGSAWNGPSLDIVSCTSTTAVFTGWASGSTTIYAKTWQVSGMRA